MSATSSWSSWMQEGWTAWWWDQYDTAVDEFGPQITADPDAFRSRVTATVSHMTATEQAIARYRAMVLDPANAAVVTRRDKASLAELEKRYNNLASGMFVDARTADASEVGDGTGVPPGRTRIPLLYSSRKSAAREKRFEDEPPTWPWSEKTPYWKDDPYWNKQNQRIDGAPVLGAPILVVLGIAFLSVAAIAWAVACIAWAAELHGETSLQEKDLAARIEASKEGRTLQPATTTGPATAVAQGPKPDGATGGIILGILAALGIGGLGWYAATRAKV